MALQQLRIPSMLEAQRREARRCLFLLRSAFLVQGMDFPALFYPAHGPAVDGHEEGRWLESKRVRDYRGLPSLLFCTRTAVCTVEWELRAQLSGARGTYAAGGESGGPIG
jgi:hypothetical protein